MSSDLKNNTAMSALLRVAKSLAPDVRDTLSDPREEVLVRYTKGTGTFSPDKRYISLKMKLYKLNGEEDGYHEGVWERQFEDPRELLARPAPPTGPMDEPVPPVPHVQPLAHTKAHWVFGDGSKIIVAGPAASHLVQLNDGSFLFSVSTAQSITGGEGRYKGAYGLVQSLGSTHIPAGVNLFGPGDAAFTATTIDTFRIVRERYYVQSGPPQPEPPPPEQDKPSAEFPFKPRYTEVNNAKMHYIEEGKGDPILFVHGNPTWSYLWRNIIPHLKDKGRCIAVDLIGMGRSERPDIGYRFRDHAKYFEGFIKKLKLKNITLVLHDWGSALGFHYAARYESNVKGIAFMEGLLHPYPTWEEFPASDAAPQLRDTFRLFRTGGEGGPGWKAIVDENIFLDKLLPQVAGRPLSEKELGYYREPFKKVKDRHIIWRWVQELPIEGDPADVTESVQNYSDKLQESSVPKLLLYAEPGAVLTAEHVRWSERNLKNLETVNVGPGAHFLQESSPNVIGRKLADWYSRLQ